MSDQAFRAQVEIPDEVLDRAALRMREFAQLAEMSTRAARQIDLALVEQISLEITSRLNSESVRPDLRELERVVTQVFERHFGPGINVKVDQICVEGSTRPAIKSFIREMV